MNTDSVINNRIISLHRITKFIRLVKKKISFTKDQNTKKVSPKICSSSFSSRKLRLNFKSDLKFFKLFRKRLTPKINRWIASINNRIL